MLLFRLILRDQIAAEPQPFREAVVRLDLVGVCRHVLAQFPAADPFKQKDCPHNVAEFTCGEVQAVLAALGPEAAQQQR